MTKVRPTTTILNNAGSPAGKLDYSDLLGLGRDGIFAVAAQSLGVLVDWGISEAFPDAPIEVRGALFSMAGIVGYLSAKAFWKWYTDTQRVSPL